MPDKSRFGDCSQPDQFIGAVGNRTYESAGRDLEISPSQTGLSVRLETAPTGVRVANWRFLPAKPVYRCGWKPHLRECGSRHGDFSQPNRFIGAVGNRTYENAGRDMEISPSQTSLSVRLETAPTRMRVANWRFLPARPVYRCGWKPHLRECGSRHGDFSQPDRFIGAVGNRTYESAGRDMEISPSQTSLSVRLETAPTRMRVAIWKFLPARPVYRCGWKPHLRECGSRHGDRSYRDDGQVPAVTNFVRSPMTFNRAAIEFNNAKRFDRSSAFSAMTRTSSKNRSIAGRRVPSWQSRRS